MVFQKEEDEILTTVSAHKRKRSEAELEEEENDRKRRKVEGINSLPHEQSPTEPEEDSQGYVEMEDFIPELDEDARPPVQTYTITLNGCQISGDPYEVFQSNLECPWLETLGVESAACGYVEMADFIPENYGWKVSTVFWLPLL